MDTCPYAVSHATRLLERLAFQINGTLHSHSPDSVHDLRVAIRRFSQVLTTCKSCFESREIRKLRTRLKRHMSLAGDVRDIDIALELIAESKIAAEPLVATLRARRKESEKTLMALLKAWAAHRSTAKWRAALQNAGPADDAQETKLADTAARKLRKMARRFFHHGSKVAQNNVAPPELHRFRIASKKFRYTLEFLSEIYGPATGEWLEQIKAVQTALGHINDCRATCELIAGLDNVAEIDAWLNRRQRRKIREFRQLWEQGLGADGVAAHWELNLRHPRRKPVGRSSAPAARAGLARHA